MKFAVPWSVKGIRPEARETAKEAARRSGMPLGEWLNSVILQQADEDGAHGSSYRDDDDSYGDELAGVHQRLDDITRRIEQFSRGPAAYAPKAGRAEPARDAQSRETAQLAQLIARLDQRIEQIAQIPRMMAAPPMVPGMAPGLAPQGMAAQGIDRAVAEIAARQRALGGGAAPGRSPQQQQPQQQVPPQVQAYAPPHAQTYTPAPVLMPVPSQDLSGLEEHLRKITDQIETLRRPGVEDAINALRAELGDIAQALSDAMPRQAIEAIERQIQGLTQRIAEGRQSGNIAGVDGSALSGIEHGLAEVRDALRGLTPAESLVGFNEAVNGLAHKIDLIVAQKDPAALGQLEHAITTLRDMAGHVASNETVGRLAAQVQHLADKVEQYGVGSGAGDALNSLEHRISALADALAERSQNGASVPPRLEALVESLSDKIEQIQQTRGDSAVGHLEDHIVALVQRLDASDSRLGHLEAIERGLGDLLVHIEELRANKGNGGLRDDNSQGVAELKNDIARTQNALDAVHGTLGLVVDRLATIERDVRAARNPLDLELTDITQPVGRIAARAVSDAPPPAAAPPQPMPQPVMQPAQPAQAPRPQAAAPQQAPQQPATNSRPSPQRLPPAARLPINPDLPPDQPLEPGSGAPRFQANGAARIAASEAALGGARAQPNGPDGKSGFIAAARRAAQAAIETATPRKPQLDAATEADDSERPTLRASVMKRVKSLLIAASIVAIVIGMVQIGGNLFKFGGANTAKEQSAQSPDAVPAADADNADTDERTATETEPPASSNQPALPLSPPVLPGMTAPPATGGNPPANAPLSMNPPSLLSPSTLTQNPDVTGSIGRNTLKQNPARPTAAPTPAKPEAERLPIALGGARLRSAAVAGDAAAAYEVALRFAEGRGVPANPEEAARWYERAAGKGLVPAQFRYASLLEKGTGVKKNLGQARKLYLAAATQGHAKAMHNLAVLYAEGIEGKPDYATAALWFRKAAQHGIADSQYNLGVLCARGLGTDKNIAEAYKWFALAANQGDREAAKKRDDVAAHLDADELASARDTVKSFVPEPQPQSAINVPVPHGGWDDATTTAPSPAKPRGGRAISANVSSLPLNIGAR
jgi:localization factor PodJL